MTLPDKFVYVIAFKDNKFIMVRHRERKWEMPGGRLMKGETHEQAAVREFFEETGMSLELVSQVRAKVPDGGKVFAGFARDAITKKPSEWNIVEVREFDELPSDLSFPLVEYRTMLDQARFIVETFKRGKGISGSASPLTR
jgi:8-oxo-dGTP diphosphatase